LSKEDQSIEYWVLYQFFLALLSMITNLIIWAFLPLQLFLLLAILVSAAPQGLEWDNAILFNLYQTANPFLDRLAQSITTLGIYGGTLPIIILLSALLTYQKQWRSLFYVVIIAYLLTQV